METWNKAGKSCILILLLLLAGCLQERNPWEGLFTGTGGSTLVTEAHGVALNDNIGGNRDQSPSGMKILTIFNSSNYNVTLVNITKANGSGGTIAYLFNTTPNGAGGNPTNQMANATFSSDTATFATPIPLNASTVYYVAGDASGDYDHRANGSSGGTYPIAGTYINWTASWTGYADYTGQFRDIISIGLNVTELIPPDVTVNAFIFNNTEGGTSFYTNQTLVGFVNISNSQSTLNGSYKFFLNETLNASGNLTGIVNNSYLNIANISSAFVKKHQNWTLQVTIYAPTGNISTNSTQITIFNSLPTVPYPTAPANGSTVFSFGGTNVSWNASTDLDGDILTYFVCLGNSSPPTSCLNTTMLKQNFSVAGNFTYYWFLNASDGENNSGNSGTYTFISNVRNFTFNLPRVIFLPTVKNSTNVSLYGQTSQRAFYNISAASYPFNLSVATQPVSIAGVTIKCALSFNQSGINPLPHTFLIADVSNLWCWADFNVSSISQKFNITVS